MSNHLQHMERTHRPEHSQTQHRGNDQLPQWREPEENPFHSDEIKEVE